MVKNKKNNMTQKTHIIANWKMQLSNQEATDLAVALSRETKSSVQKQIEIILCPSFTALVQVSAIIRGDSSPDFRRGQNDIRLQLGAQNIFYHDKGAYTGEISPLQLKELKVKYAIIGHSERRQFLNENDHDVNLKIKACLLNSLTPIMCIGETFEERRLGKTAVALIRQLTRGLEDVKLENDQKLIIAYEPVWVIGRGQAVDPEEALQAAQIIKRVLLDFFTPEIIANNITIIYGGSVDAGNVKNFVVPGLLEGVLVGSASLTFEKFSKIIDVLK